MSQLEDLEIDLGGHPGLLRRPDAARWLYVLAHGAGAGMRHSFMTAIAEALARHHVATLRWEFPYMVAGKARPDPAAIAEAAVRTVWNAAAKRVPDLPRFAGGKSFGGRMTSRAHAAEPLAELRGIAFLGFPLHPPDKPGPKGGSPAGSAGRGAKPRNDRADHLEQASGPLLFVQGDRDELAPLRRLRPVVRKLGAHAMLHVIKGGDHGFDVLVRSGRTSVEVLDEIASTVAHWMARVG